jgi:60kDa lysophospholipase
VGEILEGDEFSHQLLKKCDYAGNTAVHLAAVGPQSEILRDLLMRGASVHVRNFANNTPLYLAEKMGNDECVRLLKEAGAHLWEAESSAKTSEIEGSVSAGNGFVEVGETDAPALAEERSVVPNII